MQNYIFFHIMLAVHVRNGNLHEKLLSLQPNFCLMKIVSKQETLAAPAEKVYALASDCRNLEQFLAGRCSRWTATEDAVQCAIEGVAELQIAVTERSACDKVTYMITNDKNIPIGVEVHIQPEGQGSCVAIELDAAVPPFLSVMIQKPLQQALDMIMSKIKTETEKQ